MKFKQRGREEQAEADGAIVSGPETDRSNTLFFCLFFFFRFFYVCCFIITVSDGKRRVLFFFLLLWNPRIFHSPVFCNCTHTKPHLRCLFVLVLVLIVLKRSTGSLWHSGLYASWEKRHLQDCCRRYASRLDEIQAEGTRRAGRTRGQRCMTFAFSCIDQDKWQSRWQTLNIFSRFSLSFHAAKTKK